MQSPKLEAIVNRLIPVGNSIYNKIKKPSFFRKNIRGISTRTKVYTIVLAILTASAIANANITTYNVPAGVNSTQVAVDDPNVVTGNEISLRKFFSGYGSPHLSGKGTYIRTLYKKAVDVNDLLECKEFKDERRKQQYLSNLRVFAGLDYSLKQDKTTYTLERLHFDGDKKRRDYTSLSLAMTGSIKNDPNVIDTLSSNVMVFDGLKSISLSSSQMPDGTTSNYADISQSRLYFPKFHQFGRGSESALNVNLQTFINLIDQGLATFKQSTIAGQVHATFEMGSETGPSLKTERIFAPDKEMSILYTAVYRNNQLGQETTCQDYAKTDGGAWFPRKYIDNKYAYIKGQRILTSSETFEAIPGTVEFNIPIEPRTFSPAFPEGTEVIDQTPQTKR